MLREGVDPSSVAAAGSSLMMPLLEPERPIIGSTFSRSRTAFRRKSQAELWSIVHVAASDKWIAQQVLGHVRAVCHHLFVSTDAYFPTLFMFLRKNCFNIA